MDSRQGAGRKVVRINEKLGIKGIQNQQGTTRIIYDSLPISNASSGTTLRFFENVNNRAFPFTNLNDNKLNKGETLAMQRFSVKILSVDTATQQVRNILPLDNLAGGTNALYRSDLSVFIAEDTVVKKLPLDAMYAPFNKDSRFYGNITVNPGAGPPLEAVLGFPHDVFHFDNPIVLTENLQLVCQLQLPTFTLTLNAGTSYYLMFTMEGFGSLFSPKTPY